MRLLTRCLVLLLLLASPLVAAENSWTHLPFEEGSSIPGQVFLTSDPDIVYSVSFPGLLRSEDGGKHWKKLELRIGVEGFTVDPRQPDVLFGTAESKLLRSPDGGKSWVVVLGLENPSSERVLYPLVSHTSTGRVYAVSEDSLWKSQNGGETFTLVGPLPSTATLLQAVALFEAADGGLYLKRAKDCGSLPCEVQEWRLERSADQGRTWTLLQSDQDNAAILSSVVPHPVLAETVFFLKQVEGATEQHVFVSEDRGATDVDRGALPLGGGLIFTDPSQPETLFLLSRTHLRRSEDRGLSWQVVALPTGQETLGDARIAHFSPGRLLLYGVEGPSTFQSGDLGASWSPLQVEGPFPGAIRHAAISGMGTLYLETAAGSLMRTRDFGVTWQRFAAPSTLLAMVGDPTDDDTLYAVGSLEEGHGILRSRDGGESFAVVLEVNSSPTIYDFVALRRGNATTLVAALGNGKLARSSDGGTSWQVADLQIVPSGTAVVRQLEVDGEKLYGVDEHCCGLLGSTDGGATWSRRGAGSSQLAAGGGVLALGNYPATIATSTTGGPPYTEIDLPFTWSDSELAANDQGDFFLSGRFHLLRSRDHGVSWQSLAQGLPEIYDTPSLLTDPADRDHLILASDAGLYEGHFADLGQLSLLAGRFEARLRWRANGQESWVAAEAASLSDQSGVFRLFTPDRAEVAVQMIDGREQGGHFWTFIASMTDVEIEVEVIDSLTGERFLHHQAAGDIASVANFDAFPAVAQHSDGSFRLGFGGLPEPQPSVSVGQRFEVSAESLEGGESRTALGRLLFGETAAFSFFNPSTLDVMVNVLDGRAINGKFWIFAGSLTDTEWVLKVRDNTTGAEVTQHIGAGTFASYSTIDAF